MRLQIRAAAALAFAFAISACDDSTDPGDEQPVVVTIAVSAAPTPPAGTSPVCYTGPDATTLSQTCPVIRWNDITYWVFAYDDNRNALALVAYDEDENIVDQSERQGTRQLYLITVNQNAETVTLFGVGAGTAVVPWADLEVD